MKCSAGLAGNEGQHVWCAQKGEMDWIHCNSCFVQLAPGVALYLTSCGHMFCNTCLETGVKGGKCKICQSQCSTMQLAPDMKPDVQDFFSEPEELINKISTILDFQRKHRMRLASYWINVTKKFKIAKDEVKRLNDLCHKLNDAVNDLQRKNKILKSHLNDRSKKNDIISPFPTVFSPSMHVISPNLTPHKIPRPAKSTPYTNVYQSNLVTPSRISKQRPNSLSQNQSQRLNTSNKITSTTNFVSPNSPESAGSGYFSASQSPPSPGNNFHCLKMGTFKRK